MSRRNNDNLDKNYLGKQINVLDHGFIMLTDYMGDSKTITDAARVSYGSGTKTVREDKKLIAYLLRNKHMTPFEMCEIQIMVKLPIFVARQWIRHRTANVNEYSARFSEVKDEFYIPREEYVNPQSAINKQGREGELSAGIRRDFIDRVSAICNQSYLVYEKSLKNNVARELSRMNLPLNTYTIWYWKTDLRNLMNFIQLRIDPHAQYEIRLYAEEIANIVKVWVPEVWEAFLEYQLNAVTLSETQVKVISRLVYNEVMTNGYDRLNKLADQLSDEPTKLVDDLMKIFKKGRE